MATLVALILVVINQLWLVLRPLTRRELTPGNGDQVKYPGLVRSRILEENLVLHPYTHRGVGLSPSSKECPFAIGRYQSRKPQLVKIQRTKNLEMPSLSCSIYNTTPAPKAREPPRKGRQKTVEAEGPEIRCEAVSSKNPWFLTLWYDDVGCFALWGPHPAPKQIHTETCYYVWISGLSLVCF